MKSILLLLIACATSIGILRAQPEDIFTPFDSLTYLSGDYEGFVLTWKQGQFGYACRACFEDGPQILTQPQYNSYKADSSSTILAFRRTSDRTYHIIRPSYDYRGPDELALALPPLTDIRFYGDLIWLQSAKGQAYEVMSDLPYLKEKEVRWYRQVRPISCPDWIEADIAVWQELNGLFAVEGLWERTGGKFTQLTPISADTCSDMYWWGQYPNGESALINYDYYWIDLEAKGLQPDIALYRSTPAYADHRTVPLYRQDKLGKKWYALCHDEGLVLGPLLDAETYAIVTKEWESFPYGDHPFLKFQPTQNFTLKTDQSHPFVIISGQKSKYSLFLNNYDHAIYTTTFPVAAISPDPAPWNDHAQFIAAKSVGNGQLKWGVLNGEAYADIPALYDAIRYETHPNTNTPAYHATLKGQSLWFDPSGDPIE